MHAAAQMSSSPHLLPQDLAGRFRGGRAWVFDFSNAGVQHRPYCLALSLSRHFY